MSNYFEQNLAQVLQAVQQDNVKPVLGTDLFDTILIRKIDRPVDVFSLVENKYSSSATEKTLRNFSGYRQRSEREARIAAGNAGRNEVTLKEIYEHFARITRVSTDVALELMQNEIDAELDVAEIRHQVVDVICQHLDKVDSILIISDTYLPRDVIEQLLRKTGLAARLKTYKLYLSCEEHRTKHDGNLVPSVLEKEGIERRRFVYVGDNVRSDVVNCNRHGIRAVHVPKAAFYSKKRGLYFRHDTHRLGSALAQGYINSGLDQMHDSPDELAINTFAYSLATLWLGFMRWMTGDWREKKIEKVFFLSRDGYVFNNICSQVPQLLQSEYLYISREILYKAYFYVNYENACCYVHQNYSNHTLEESISRIFDREDIRNEVLNRLPAIGFLVSSPIKSAGDAIDWILATYKEELVAQGKTRYESYVKYLKKVGFLDNRKVAIVDLGWHGSLQRILKDIIEFSGTPHITEINGYYLGLFKAAPPDSYGSYYNGYLCDRGRKEENFEADIRQSPSLIEILHAAPHGSAANISSKGTVVLRENDIDKTTLNVISAIQVRAINMLIQIYSSAGGQWPEISKEESLGCLAQLLKSPSRDIVCLAAHFELAPDFGLSKKVGLIDAHIKDVSTAHWRAGTLKYLAEVDPRKSRVPKWFNEFAYLNVNPDVADALLSGLFRTGFEHYERFGKAENRKLG